MATLTNLMKQGLDLFFGLTQNYWLAIFLLTVLVRLVILPLTLYQAKSMKRIQEVQPKMKELQERYKDQKEKLNKAMMELYQKEKVNPMSGCLPLLIQLPFLWAIFGVLRVPANFGAATDTAFLWLTSVTDKDPLYILPIITIAVTFLQSYLTGSSSDPNQRVMLYTMPLMIGVFTFSMPAGLVLYWATSTTFGIVQQAIYPGFPKRVQGGTA